MSIELGSQPGPDAAPPSGPPGLAPIEILRLSRRELALRIRDELERNPFLEERIPTLAQDRQDAERELSSIERFEFRESEPPALDEDRTAEVMGAEGMGELEWALGESSQAPPPAEELAEELLLGARGWSSQPSSLYDHLLDQLRLGDFTWAEKEVALEILENLDEDGYLRIDVNGDPLIAIASRTRVSLATAAKVLRKLQGFEPAGVCARDLEECLLLQARARGEEGGVVEAIIRRHLPALTAHSLRSIAAALDVELSEVVRAERVIAEMDPKPGRSFVGDESYAVFPDVTLTMIGGRAVASADDPLASLRLSQRYLLALRAGRLGEPEAGAFLREQLGRARALLHAVRERRRILVQLTEAIASTQRSFLEYGPKHLEPERLSAIASRAGLPLEVVQGALTAKQVGTPFGVLPLRAFVSGSDEAIHR